MHRSNSAHSVPRSSAVSFATFGLVVSQVVFCGPLAVGPVDAIDRQSGTVNILGQSFPLASASASELGIGQLLWIDGQVDLQGVEAITTVYVLSELNVPGETQLYISGFVSNVSRSGTLTVGRLLIDFTGLLSDAPVSVAAGDLVEVFGIQPSSGGVLLADDLKVVSGIVGTGKQGIVGTGTLGIVGTGKQGIVGTGTLGIVGTGIQ